MLVFTDLVKTLSNFDKFLTQMSKRTGLASTSLAKRSVWVMNERKFERDLRQLQYSKLSLTSMLSLVQM